MGRFGLGLLLGVIQWLCRSRCPRGLRRRSAAARLLGLWVRIPPGAWMSACVECCVLSGRGLCDGLITPPEESYRLWCVIECNLETPRMRRPWPTGGLLRQKKKNPVTFRRHGWKWQTVVVITEKRGSETKPKVSRMPEKLETFCNKMGHYYLNWTPLYL